MHLEKLEIQGFKSFANKNTLLFPGMISGERRGITAVVGPNGSGKSNVADAIRWVLGEQSMKTLRGKKSEDVIFSGSDKKGKLGMAEVSLHLNNEDRRVDVDYSQLIVTRRIYRDGESEYLINGARVRLMDVQMLLAKASFGQKTYSVIGQGMVEGFLNVSPAERKEFFDEATGVKQYQIRRDESLAKLKSSYENLGQARMLVEEIEPRLKSLTRQVLRLRKRDEVETELKSLQNTYYSYLWRSHYKNYSDASQRIAVVEAERVEKDSALAVLLAEHERMERESGRDEEFDRCQSALAQAQSRRDEVSRRLMRLEASMEAKLEANGRFDLSFLLSRQDEIARQALDEERELLEVKTKIETAQKNLRETEESRSSMDQKRNKLESELSKLLSQHSQVSGQDASALMLELRQSLQEIELLETVGEIKESLRKLSELFAQLDNALKGTTQPAGPSEKYLKISHQIKQLSQFREELIGNLSEQKASLRSWEGRAQYLSGHLRQLAQERAANEAKINKAQEDDPERLAREQVEIASSRQELSLLETEVNTARADVAKVNARSEESRSRLFALQREIRASQDLLATVVTELNSLRVSLARSETKLEDIDAEIRSELGNPAPVKEMEPGENVDIELLRERIASLKKQMDLIGGIDPQVEDEYIQAKERFEFLSEQIKDLEDASQSLQEVIKELDVAIKERFDREFETIAKNFEKYFKILFNGGTAKIVPVMDESTDAEDTTEAGRMENELLQRIKNLQKRNASGLSGIDIQATPPGKKIKFISMLSGGERALTAIALICAIISSNPSPFVVLDEVDAALDEANSERLAAILDELSTKTQFILITHNRAPMRKANILYGVTMGEDGVSKLLSVKFDETKNGR